MPICFGLLLSENVDVAEVDGSVQIILDEIKKICGGFAALTDAGK